MRRKPTSQGGGGSNGGGGGYNNQQRNKPRYQSGGGGGGDHRSHNNHNNGGRPRKNYAASREKYLSQARDALAAGDRVLAENYFQHADHCYRMMVEEGYQVRNNYTPPPHDGAQADGNGEHVENGNGNSDENSVPQEEMVRDNVSHQLPAFLTASFDQAGNAQAAEPVVVPSWEEN